VIRSGQRAASIAAVGSRTPETANGFAAERKIASVHGSYDALIADPCGRRRLHFDAQLAAPRVDDQIPLRAGKHVLCEKPFALTATQAKEMFDAAEEGRQSPGRSVHVPLAPADARGDRFRSAAGRSANCD
jgi:predicted dehydrogenase